MFPTTQDGIKPALLLLLLYSGGEVASKDAYRPLANFFDLSAADRSKLRPTHGKGRLWDNWVQYARDKLRSEGLVLPNTDRGRWQLAERGRVEAERLDKDPKWRDHPRVHHLTAARG